MKKLIIETDLGGDPDDLFAICFLIGMGVDIKGIIVTPGGFDQIAVANLIREECNQNFMIAKANPDRDKNACNGFHYKVLEHFNKNSHMEPDIDAQELLKKYIPQNTDLLTIGPPKASGKFARNHPDMIWNKIVIQGGFMRYSMHNFNCERVEKFKGKKYIPTFNLNGAKQEALSLIASKAEYNRYFVSKNLCHTIFFDYNLYNKIENIEAKTEAGELFRTCASLYFTGRDKKKKFHDPLAAFAYLYPKYFDWVRANMVNQNGGWGAELDKNGDFVAADVNRKEFWEKIMSF